VIEQHEKVNTASIKETANRIADKLEETAHEPKAIIYRIVRTIGIDPAMALLQKAQEIESNDGMMLPDGSRRRTIGGVYFQIVKAEVTSKQRFAIWRGPSTKGTNDGNQEQTQTHYRQKSKQQPTEPAKQFTWNNRIEAVQEADAQKGRINTVKVTIIGRPGKIVERSGCIVTVMDDTKVPALPKGLPTPTSAPVKYAVYIASKQWKKVEEAIKDPEDILIVEGHPKTDPQVSAIAVFATNVTTKKLQQAQRQAG